MVLNQLHKAQAQILSDTHRFRTLVCGRKFGKTTLATEEIKGCAFAQQGRRVIYIAPTLDDARRLVWDKLKLQFRNCVEKSNDTRMELVIPTQDGGTSTIFLGSWEKFENYRGDEFDLEIFDEVQNYKKFWVGWHDAMRPTLTPRRGSALFMGTPKGFNHFYDLHNFELKDPNFKSFHFTTYDNPFIPPEEIEEAKRTLSPESFAQEYLAQFTKTEGLVYKEFDRAKHLYTGQGANFHEVIAGVDFGFRAPAAAYSIGIDSSDTWWVHDEYYKTGKTDADVAEYVAAKGYNKVYPDPESQSGIEEMRRRGVNIAEVIKGKDSIKNGIDKLRDRFRANKLKVHVSCVNLINELETYAYGEKRENHSVDENPIDENNHALDALRYCALMHGNDQFAGKVHIYIPQYD